MTSNGVSTMPIRLENEALQIAAATLPRAIEVNAIEDCTVDGRQHRNITPVYSPGVSAHGTSSRESKPSNGNSTNVARNTSPCSRQCLRPSSASRVESLAPYRKNSSPMAIVVAWPKPVAAAPLAGSSEATATVNSNARM